MPGSAKSAKLTRAQPKYPLAQVKAVIKLARIGERVLQRAARDYSEDLSKVKKFIHKTIDSLDEGAFVETKPQTYNDRSPIDADIYAVENQEGVWYIKFYIEHGQVTVLSFHEPDYPIRRIDGTILKANP